MCLREREKSDDDAGLQENANAASSFLEAFICEIVIGLHFPVPRSFLKAFFES